MVIVYNKLSLFLFVYNHHLWCQCSKSNNILSQFTEGPKYGRVLGPPMWKKMRGSFFFLSYTSRKKLKRLEKI